MGDELWRLVFVNNGVKLTIEDSEILPVLQDFEQDGLQILVSCFRRDCNFSLFMLAIYQWSWVVCH